jgi:hypothetical protein
VGIGGESIIRIPGIRPLKCKARAPALPGAGWYAESPYKEVGPAHPQPAGPITMRRGMPQFHSIHRGRQLEMMLKREVRIPQTSGGGE